MTAHKVADLLGAELDCAVAKAMGLRWSFVPTDPEFGMRRALCVAEITPNPHIDGFPVFSPSTRWEHGGPIIQRERIATAWLDSRWNAWMPGCSDQGYYGEYALDVHASDANGMGDTPLIAAMRAFVASKLGETVELP